MGRQQPFPLDDCGCCYVCLSGWFGAGSSSPKVKHITQMCHNLGCAWTLLKASVSPQQESGASFDGKMAFLPFLSCCLPVPAMGTLQGCFICGDVSEEEDHDFSSLCPIAIKIFESVGAKRKVKTKKDNK